MMIRSMTGFAAANGALSPHFWVLELRSVNGKGQDLRLRVPDWITGLEIEVRKKLAAATARGNISLALRVNREETASTVQINTTHLTAVLDGLAEIETQAMDAGISLAPSKASDIIALRGILEASATQDDVTGLLAALLTQVDALISDFDAMRVNEGAALEKMLLSQLAEVSDLTQQAKALAAARSEEMAQNLRRNLARVMDNVDGADDARIAQELAMIAVKADITEEIDRLGAHIEAARGLIDEGGAVGRKLDFLMQEFNREANTLCAKAQSTDLTSCGLALKAVIDQMREQVQNVE